MTSWIDDDSSSLYRALVEAMPDGVVVIDNMRIVFVNPAAVALAGADSADQIVGRSVSQFVSPRSRPQVDELARRHGTGAQPDAMQIDFRRMDGTMLIAEVTTVRVDAMPPWVALVVLKDVTERERLIDELARANTRNRFLADNATDVLIRACPTMGIGYATTSSQVVLGLDPSSLTGRQVRELFVPADHVAVDAAMAAAAETGRATTIEVQAAQSGGVEQWVQATLRAVDSVEACDGIEFHVTISDITERRAVAERLRRSAALLSSVMRASAAEAIVVTDTEAMIVAFSRGAEDLFGLDAADVVGTLPMLDLHDPADIARYAAERGTTAPELMRRPPPDGDLLNIELVLRRGDGSTFLGSMNVSTRTDDQGVPVGFLYVVTDITERRRAEENLLDLVAKDHLTGLLNRRALETRLERMAAEEWWQAPGRVLMFIDLDHFKQVNDSAGHQAGDRVLTEVGQRIGSCVRLTDAVFRYGGDEFVVLFDATVSLTMANDVGQRIVQRIREPFIVDGGVAVIGASVGIARSNASVSPAALITDADTAVYAAKRRGRGCVVTAA
jgi:diguanylate cyclase (GGDEF)-like protein/PAS domain S-box-containing protein